MSANPDIVNVLRNVDPKTLNGRPSRVRKFDGSPLTFAELRLAAQVTNEDFIAVRKSLRSDLARAERSLANWRRIQGIAESYRMTNEESLENVIDRMSVGDKAEIAFVLMEEGEIA